MTVAVSTQLYDEARLELLRPLLERDAALGAEIFPEWQLTLEYDPRLGIIGEEVWEDIQWLRRRVEQAQEHKENA